MSGVPQVFGVGGVQSLTDGATITLDLTKQPVAAGNIQSSLAPDAQVGLGSAFKVTLGGNRNLDVYGLVDGQIIHMFVTQDGTGSRTMTPRVNGQATTVLTSGTPLTTTAGATDLVALQYRQDLGMLLYYPIAKNLA